jgi:hypothetical protein
MNKAVSVVATALLFCTTGAKAQAAETPHIQFVQEYIRELSEMEDIRASAEVDLKRKDTNQFADAIHWSTRNQLALRTNISILNGMHISGDLGFLIPHIVAFYQQKLDIHERLIAIATEFMSGPKPGVDYGKLAAEMPKLQATLEYTDESFLKMSAMVFVTLIDPKPDSANHMSRLIITSAERQDLLNKLKTDFGTKLDQKHENNFVGSAEVLRSYLRKDKGYKCSDET